MAVYLVVTPNGKRLIQADLKSVAVNHVVRQNVTAEAVTAEELLEYIGQGMVVEKAETKTKEETTND